MLKFQKDQRCLNQRKYKYVINVNLKINIDNIQNSMNKLNKKNQDVKYKNVVIPIYIYIYVFGLDKERYVRKKNHTI